MPTTRSAKKAKAQEEPQAEARSEPVSGSEKRTQQAAKASSPKKGRKAAAAQPSPKAGSKRKAAEPEPQAAAADSGDDGQLEQQGKEQAAGDRAEPEQQEQEAGGDSAEAEQQEKEAAGDRAEPEQREEEASGGKAEAEQDVSLPDNAVEEGKVSFMFRHKVTTPGADVDASDLDDVQRLYLLLEPHSPPGGKCRLIVVPKKKLPDAQRHERFFAFVEAVGDSLSELTAGLGEHTYSTKTRGERLQPAAQPAGEGTYVIAKGGSRNGIHLGFKLSSPSQPGEVQEMLGIHDEGSFVLSAKNPDKKGQGPPNVPSAGPEPQYSDEQREEFGGRSWIGVEDRSLLDVAGTELLVVGAKVDPTEDLGDADKLLEEAA